MNSYIGYVSVRDSEIVDGKLVANQHLSIHRTAEEAIASRSAGTARRTIFTTTDGEYFHVKQGTVASTGVWIEDTYGRRFLTYAMAYVFAHAKGRDGTRAEIVLMTPYTTELNVTGKDGLVHTVGTTTVWEEIPVGQRLELMPKLFNLVPETRKQPGQPSESTIIRDRWGHFWRVNRSRVVNLTPPDRLHRGEHSVIRWEGFALFGLEPLTTIRNGKKDWLVPEAERPRRSWWPIL